MTLRSIPNCRPRKLTAEYRISHESNCARRARGVELLIAAGLTAESASMCVHVLNSGAADAFARACACVVAIGVDAETFRRWCIGAGFHDAVGEKDRRAVQRISLADIKREFENNEQGEVV